MNCKNLLMYTLIGTALGATVGLTVAKKMNSKSFTIKKTAGKALRAAGSFIEHMSF